MTFFKSVIPEFGAVSVICLTAVLPGHNKKQNAMLSLEVKNFNRLGSIADRILGHCCVGCGGYHNRTLVKRQRGRKRIKRIMMSDGVFNILPCLNWNGTVLNLHGMHVSSYLLVVVAIAPLN